MLSQSPQDPQQYSQERHIAAIDLGSNSFHMVVAKTDHGELRILDKIGEKVQLASGINAKGRITDEAMQRAIDCLNRFAQRIREFDADDVQIVGTNALRVAKNQKDFIKAAQKVVGFPIEVISGHEEARLIYLGVSQTMADDAGKRLVIDIGGGSTEFIIGERFEPLALESLHMGCVSYRERYLDAEIITEAAFDHAVLQASRELLNIKKQYKHLGWHSAVGSSGTIKAIATALEFNEITDGSISFKALKALKKRMLEVATVSEFGSIGVKEERASVFASGLAILYACFKTLDIESLRYTSGALREGLLYDTIGRIEHEDVRNRTIQSLQARYKLDVQQSDIVEQTMMHIYEQVAASWNIRKASVQNLLRWASRVYEIGHIISHSQHHKHAAYLIEHADLAGFSNRAKSFLAVIVRLHRRKFALEVLEDFDADDQVLLTKLCVLFRLAILLTASRMSAETDFSLTATSDSELSLILGADWLSEHPLTCANLQTEQDNLRKIAYELTIT